VAVAASSAIADSTGASGASNASGPSGPTGLSGLSGLSGPSGPSASSGASGVTPAPPAAQTRVAGVPAAKISSGLGAITIRLNGPADASSPAPLLKPSVAGTWSFWADNATFRPTTSFAPCASYTLTLPAGLYATAHKPLGHAQTTSFSVACPSVKALQEALARLNYLPYKLESFSGVGLNVPLTVGLAAQRAYALPHGWLKRDYRSSPTLQPGQMDPTTTGALEVWEQDHDVPLGTAPDAGIWHSLLSEEAHNARNPRPYTWVTVTENTKPELLKVHENNRVVLTSPTNTGIPGRATETGEYPIYVRYTATTMSGTNPDGSHYDDPGVPWVNYFNGGDAVHGFIRPAYGYPQSLGCVELPITTAEKVYYKLMVGDMVDVSD